MGTGERIRAALEQRGLTGSATSRTRSSSPRAAAVEDFMNPDRIVIGSFDEAAGDRVAALYDGLRRADRPDERRLGGDDQARRERVPRDADQLHQRDRERLRGGRGRRGRGRVRHGPRQADRDELPQARHRLRRELLPEGRVLPEAAGREQRLPLPARERGDRGQRPPEAARRREAQAAPGRPARARRSRSSGSPSSRTPTTCARRRRSCSPRGCSAEGADVHAWDPLVESHPGLDGVVDRGVAARRRARTRTPR